MSAPTPTEPPRSRRAILAGALGGLGLWAAGAVERATPAAAASGDPIRAGKTTAAGTANTTLTTKTSGPALRVVQAGNGNALRGESTGGHGAYLQASAAGAYGLYARNVATAAGTGGAILAEGGKQAGVRARSANPNAAAVDGIGTATTGYASGVRGETKSPEGIGVLGSASAATGSTHGVYGHAVSPSGHGVFGYASSSTGVNHGVLGYSNSREGDGVQGRNVNGGKGVYGESTGAPFGAGVAGYSASSYGVYGASTDYFGVYGTSSGAAAVYGRVYNGNQPGVLGISNDGAGVTGQSTNGPGITAYGLPAGTFYGNVNVTGILSKGGGAFRIDHPLAPARKYLQHSFVESPDMLNIYNGVASADADGTATVGLPDWFGALNRDYRYALTAIGEPMPDLHVRRGIAKNRFEIAGAAPGGQVSWQVTGIRKDAWAEANRIQVEVDKPGRERGRYLHPELYGKPASKGMGAEHRVHASPRPLDRRPSRRAAPEAPPSLP